MGQGEKADQKLRRIQVAERFLLFFLLKVHKIAITLNFEAS